VQSLATHETKVHWARGFLVTRLKAWKRSDDLRRATALWRAAYRYQMDGELTLPLGQ